MIPWSGIPFLRFTLAFSFGIAVYFLTGIDFASIIFCLISFSLYLLGFIIQKNNNKFFYGLRSVLGVIALLFLFFAGFSLASLRDENKDWNHLVNFSGKIESYTGFVSGFVEEKPSLNKFEFTITDVFSGGEWIEKTGKIILYVPKDKNAIGYGDRLLVRGGPREVEAPALPGEFDYKNYLKYHHIFHQHFVRSADIVKLTGVGGNDFLNIVYSLRSFLNHVLKQQLGETNEFNISAALLLGIRSGLDQDIKEAYSETGTMHVLAISGLHVSVIFSMLMLLFVYLPQGTFENRLLTFAVLFLFLWSFAFITGFSASVVRAVFMFSIVLLSKLLRKNGNIYNSISLSAFCLLLYDPMLIADAGFQLSFLAVTGIVYFSDRIYYLWKVENRMLNWIWRICSISLAAQIAVLPLSIYYFKQIPVYFLLANLFVIPLSGIILYMGVLLLLVFWIPYLSTIVAWVFSKSIWVMNQIILLIGNMPGKTIQGLSISFFELIILYLALILLSAFFYHRKIFYFKAFFGVLLLFSSSKIYSILNSDLNRITFSVVKGNPVVVFKSGSEAYVLVDKLSTESFEWSVKPYLSIERIEEYKICQLNDMASDFIFTNEFQKYLVFGSRKIEITEEDNHNSFAELQIVWKSIGKKQSIILLNNKGMTLYDSSIDPKPFHLNL